MLYDARAGSRGSPFLPTAVARDGSVPFPTPCRTLDAAGEQIPYLLWCDTDTGECEYYDRGPDGFYLDPETKRVATVREFRPAPLTVVKLAKGEPYLLKKGKAK